MPCERIRSNLEVFKCSNVQVFKRSNVQMFECLNVLFSPAGIIDALCQAHPSAPHQSKNSAPRTRTSYVVTSYVDTLPMANRISRASCFPHASRAANGQRNRVACHVLLPEASVSQCASRCTWIDCNVLLPMANKILLSSACETPARLHAASLVRCQWPTKSSP